jgi:hypothetical protein
MTGGRAMSHEGFMFQHRTIGKAAAWAVFGLGILYAVTTVLGLLSLHSSQEPIGDPFFSIMELLTVLIASLMVVNMVVVHVYAPSEMKVHSLMALIFMTLLAGITSSVHFVVLSVSHQIVGTGLTWVPLLISFKWPSVAYTLDILAWDWFFPLSMLCAAPIFKVGRLEKTVRILMMISGGLSLAGLIGVPLEDMQVRMIGVLGYAVVSPIVFLLLGMVFDRASSV